MRALIPVVLFAALQLASFAAQPWQKITLPSYQEARSKFAEPPPEYSLMMWWFWNSAMPEADIRRDLDDLHAHGVRSVMLWCYKGLEIEYLSPTWFARVRYAVDEAARRGMRVWLADEGCYPTGFMGGRISREFPELRMQVLAPGDPPKPIFKTAPTRYIHHPRFSKDSSNSLFDSLNPAATKVFLEGVHEKYRAALGDHLGKTVLGFMGDEPSFPGVPWTPAMPEAFESRKGYDIRPRLAQLFDKSGNDEARRVRADYWDVWSDLYRDNFFKPQAEWCERNGVEYEVHLCGEENMRELVALNGDYFKCQRYTHIPGVDAIWRQIWPGVVADFPKLASSSAHLNGTPRSFVEAFAIYGHGTSLEQAKWVMDHLLVRGINQFQMMDYLSSQEASRRYFAPPDWHGSPQWSQFRLLAEYGNRASYLLSVGRPMAKIAIYYPTSSAWLRDYEPNRMALTAAKDLLERQRDFDFIDEQALSAGVRVENGEFLNASDQAYGAVIVPKLAVISAGAMGKLKTFARTGGKVIFLGGPPALLVRKSFLTAAAFNEDLSWAIIEPAATLTDKVLAALPAPDVTLTPAAAPVKYLHRAWSDSELYFFFNESDRELDLDARLNGRGVPEFWDAVTGEMSAAPGWSRAGKQVRVPLKLAAHESRFVIVGRGPSKKPKLDAPLASAALEGEWKLQLNGQTLTTPLKSWSDLGQAPFSGTAVYTKSIQAPAGKKVFVDLGEVRYSARLKVNGKDLGPRAWRPYRWDISAALQPGENTLEVEVTNTLANELSGNPERLKEVERNGWLTGSYYRTYSKFDPEMVPSGLMGPVRLLWH